MKALIFLSVMLISGISFASDEIANCDCDTGEGFANKACKNSCVEKSVSSEPIEEE